MPVYNGEIYLQDAIDSVLSQTCEDFEFIIVNDGSIDSSETIILRNNDSRIKYIWQENTGIGGALQRGCSLAQGIYIARMDADDICLPDRLEKQKLYLENNPSCVLISNAVIYIDDNGKSIGRSFPFTSHTSIIKKFKQGSPICHPSVMMRKSAYLESGGYENLQLLEDLHLWMKLSKLGKLANLSTPLLKYRILNNSISRSILQKHYNEIIKFLISNENALSEFHVQEVNYMYKLAKNIAKEKKTIVESPIEFSPNTKLELTVYNGLRKLKLSEKITESVVCMLKNIMMFFFA